MALNSTAQPRTPLNMDEIRLTAIEAEKNGTQKERVRLYHEYIRDAGRTYLSAS